MAGNSIGKSFVLTTCGESHGVVMMCIIDGCPPGLSLTETDIQVELDRRRPAASRFTSQRSELLIQHLKLLRQGKTVEIPKYDFALHQRKKETRTLGQHRIIVLEGILLFVDPELRKMMDIRIFMDTSLDICLMRRLRRDLLERGRSLESILDQYQNTVRPMYLQFIEPSKKYADIIVPRGGENRIAIDMIKAKMRELLDHTP